MTKHWRTLLEKFNETPAHTTESIQEYRANTSTRSICVGNIITMQLSDVSVDFCSSLHVLGTTKNLARCRGAARPRFD